MFKILSKLLLVLIISTLTFLIAPDVDAAKGTKYSSSSSKSSFSSRPANKTPPPVRQPASAPQQKKYTSSSSRNDTSTTLAIARESQRERAATSYNTATRPTTATEIKPRDTIKPSIPPKPQVASTQSTRQQSSTYSQSNYNRQQNSHNSQSSGVSLTDIVVAGLVINELFGDNDTTQPAIEQPRKRIDPVSKKQTVSMSVLNDNVVQRSVNADLPTINMCTGPSNQGYHIYGQLVANAIDGYNLNLIPTIGSNENLTNIGAGKCDVAIIQRDTINTYPNLPAIHRVATPYADEGILMCKSDRKINKISDITKKHTIAVLPDTSGSYSTWKVLDDAYDISATKVNATDVLSQFMLMHDDKVDCTFAVSTTQARVFSTISSQAASSGKYNLVDIPTRKLRSYRDPVGEKLYNAHTIKSTKNFSVNSYATFLGFRLWKTSSTNTISIPNDVVVSKNMMEDTAMFEAVVRATNKITF